MLKFKNHLKKSLSVALSMMLVLSALSVVSTANVAAEEKQGTVSFLEEVYQQYSEVVDKISQGLENFDEQIDVSKYNIPVDQTLIVNIFNVALYKNPELFFVSHQFSYSYSSQKNIVSKLYVTYLYDESEIVQKEAELQEVIQTNYLSKINSSMSDFEKAVILHDEIILNAGYTDGTSIYDFLVEGKGQCIAYVLAYSYLLSLTGVDSEIITSDDMNHAWCKVKIDGEYYNVDITYDDPVQDRLGLVSHTYFLFSDEVFENPLSGMDSHYDFDNAYYKATSTRFDNYTNLHAINTRLCFSDDTCYAVYNKNGSDYTKSLVTYDVSDDSMTVVNKFDARWSAGSGRYWSAGFMSLDEYDGILYCNTDNSIYYYDIATGRLGEYDTSADLENMCYGLMIKGEEIYVAKTSNPNVTGEWVYAGDVMQTAMLSTNLVKGDLNDDGDVTILDATLIQKYIIKSINLDSTHLALADVDGDGLVTIQDATLIQEYTVGIVLYI